MCDGKRLNRRVIQPEVGDRMYETTTDFHTWFKNSTALMKSETKIVPVTDLTGWSINTDTGYIRHTTGRFFTIKGLEVTHAAKAPRSWHQPIIDQPEEGILGLLVRRLKGEVYCLMQVKSEPGNINAFQLSPTVQATKSNYSRAHGGRSVPLLEHFHEPREGKVLYDSLQSEQASWFLAKKNRNLILEIDSNIAIPPNFCWLSLRQVSELLKVPNLINMDTRTVLSGLVPTYLAQDHDDESEFRNMIAHSSSVIDGPICTRTHLISWFTEETIRSNLSRKLRSLKGMQSWLWTDTKITHQNGRHFDIIGVEASISGREVDYWHQPMLKPRSKGLVAFLCKPIHGVLCFLVQAREETGALNKLEMAPTLQCQPANYLDESLQSPMFLNVVESASPSSIRFDTRLSEEGGRFYHAESRYMLVEVEDDFPNDVPKEFKWMTLGQLIEFSQFSNHLNIEARCLLALTGFYKGDKL